MGIQVLNQSKYVTDADVAAMTAAINIQTRDHVPALWDRKPMSVSTWHHPSWWKFYLVDEIPEAPGALAFHDVGTDGKPYGRIGVKTTLDAGELVSVSLSHEAVELQVDLYCQLWAYSQTRNADVAYEACDPVEGSSYPINGIQVSNFITPWWFVEDGLVHQYDYMHHLARPYSLERGGYVIQAAQGTVKSVWGSEPNPAVVAGKEASHGRSYWRQIDGALKLAA